jgi:hypothetical protein
MVPNATPAPLASHWQAGGWFGSQLGSSAWLLVSALVVAPHAPASAGVLLGCFAAVNALGCLLWTQRARLDPYLALQLLVAASVLAGAVATRWLELRGEFALLDPRVGPRTMYGLLALLWLVLGIVFAAKGRAARRAAAA